MVSAFYPDFRFGFYWFLLFFFRGQAMDWHLALIYLWPNKIGRRRVVLTPWFCIWHEAPDTGWHFTSFALECVPNKREMHWNTTWTAAWETCVCSLARVHQQNTHILTYISIQSILKFRFSDFTVSFYVWAKPFGLFCCVCMLPGRLFYFLRTGWPFIVIEMHLNQVGPVSDSLEVANLAKMWLIFIEHFLLAFAEPIGLMEMVCLNT